MKKLQNNIGLLIIIAILLICLMPFLLTRNFGLVDFTQTGTIGDTIGGITAPIIGLLSAVLLYLALHEQKAATLLQEKAIIDQRKALQIQIDHSIISDILSEFKNDLTSIGFKLKETDGYVKYQGYESFWKFNELFSGKKLKQIEISQLKQYILSYTGLLERFSKGLARIKASKLEYEDKLYFYETLKKYRSPLSIIPESIKLNPAKENFEGIENVSVEILKHFPMVLKKIDEEIENNKI